MIRKVLLIIITTLLLTACTAPTAVPTATPNVTETTSPTITPTKVPMPSPEPTLTPTPKVDPPALAELDQQIRDFLKKEGNFTEEKIQQIIIYSRNRNVDENTKLGLVDITEDLTSIEGLLHKLY